MKFPRIIRAFARNTFDFRHGNNKPAHLIGRRKTRHVHFLDLINGCLGNAQRESETC